MNKSSTINTAWDMGVDVTYKLLIENLGGYENAKAKFRDNGSLHAERLKAALLEYRRQHNIFESEDKIVVKNDCLIDFADLTLNLKVLTVLMVTDEGFIHSIEAAGLFKSSLVRHANPEEIKAGRRLP